MDQLRSESLANIHIDEIRREVDPHQAFIQRPNGPRESRGGHAVRTALKGIATSLTTARIGRGRSVQGHAR